MSKSSDSLVDHVGEINCLKCGKGILLPVDRVVNLGYNIISDELTKWLKRGMSRILFEELGTKNGTIRVWKCSNPECGFEVKCTD